MKYFWVVFLTSFAMSWFFSRARRTKAKHIGSMWLFAPILGVRILYCLVFAMGMAFIVFGARGPREDRTVVVTGGLGFIVFVSLTWPKTVQVLEFGLRQRSWNGRWKALPWKEISEVKEKRDKSVVVLGTGGKIVLSPIHAGRELFLSKLREAGHPVVKRNH